MSDRFSVAGWMHDRSRGAGRPKAPGDAKKGSQSVGNHGLAERLKGLSMHEVTDFCGGVIDAVKRGVHQAPTGQSRSRWDDREDDDG